jgi:integrase
MLDEARKVARAAISDVWHGEDPIAKRNARREQSAMALTLRAFVEQHYEPWALAHQKRGAETVQRVRAVFVDLLDEALVDLTAWRFEKWRAARLKTTPAPRVATVNSHLTLLKGVLTKATTWKILASPHALVDIKPLKTDKTGRIRYLWVHEEQYLRAALKARDAQRQQRREQANAWRRARGYKEWPTENPDHLTPIVLLALNTGLRKGEIFNLTWADVDWTLAQLTVRGESDERLEGSKSRQTRYVPLNREALDTLKAWRAASAEDGYVFPGDDGERLIDIKKAWLPVLRAATITNFTFHDLRHTFASKLVMAGVDLNTVRELLGHSDIKMTLRYAHLAPEHKAAAVARLVAHGA